jgi:SUKH-3 immunity protein of toxin-antitoxin system/YwqJ-like deaminase
MISLEEAEFIAEGWAHKQSIRRGYPCTPHVDELALGYAVWMQLPPDVRTEPGEDVTTVIDRETGRLSHWPPASLSELDERYRERRDAAVGQHRTADPTAELKREAHRRVSPAVAAHITLGDRLFRARGAKGDQEIRHHPLVAQLLGAIPPENTIRGAERHAELLVVSDVLYEADKARDTPLGLGDARVLLQQGEFETFHIRESGDPLGGQPARSCFTCESVLIELALRPESRRVDRRQTAGTDPEPGRFPPEVAWELAHRGWLPESRERRARLGTGEVARIAGQRGAEFAIEEFPAARAAFTEFFGVLTSRSCPGVAQRVRSFDIGGFTHLTDPLCELGIIVGARMFPLGTEGFDEAVLAIDERGRVFALDQGGEWFLGETLDQALVALLMGHAAARLHDDGTWRTQQ